MSTSFFIHSSFLVMSVVAAGCATRTVTPTGPVESVSTLSEPIPANLARVVVMRPADDRKDQLLNVFQDGRFHTSVQPGEYTVLHVCPNDPGYLVTSLESPLHLKRGQAVQLMQMSGPIPQGRQQVYRVSVRPEGQVSAETVDTDVNWSNLREQRRLVSRVVADCKPAPVTATAPAPTPVAPAPAVTPVPVAVAPVVPASQTRTLTIPSDLAFPFASYSLDDSVGGVQIRQRLEQFMREAGFQNVTSVVVTGHSDPVGAPHRKELVSNERAKAVANFLVRQAGIPADKVQARSMSDRELLVNNCPARPVAQRDACNAPNRRVEIAVTGTR